MHRASRRRWSGGWRWGRAIWSGVSASSAAIFHGRLSLDQLFSARPVLGHADHRMPVPGLYLCGSGAHPGGGVTGAPGHNAARAVLKDLRR